MEKIIADEALRIQLTRATTALEVLDKEGTVLGHFLPPAAYRRFVDDVTNPPELTTEEFNRRVAAGGGRPLADIWKDLGQA